MAQVEVLNIDTKLAQSSIKQLRQELKRLQDQMAGLEEGSEEFLKVATSAGQVKHQIDEIRDSVNGASADFGDMLSTSTTALNGIVGGLTAAQGAMNLFGIESEATVEAMKKLQALMAIGQGIAQIDNGIKAFNKFKKAIETTTLYQKLFGQQTKVTTDAINQQNIANNTVTGSTNKFKQAIQNATTESKAFWKSLSTGVKSTVILAAIALIIKGIQSLIEKFKEAFDISAKLEGAISKIQTRFEAFDKRLEIAKGTADYLTSLYTFETQMQRLASQIEKTTFTFNEFIKETQRWNTIEGDDYKQVYITYWSRYNEAVDNVITSLNELNGLGIIPRSETEKTKAVIDDIKGSVDAIYTLVNNARHNKNIPVSTTQGKELARLFARNEYALARIDNRIDEINASIEEAEKTRERVGRSANGAIDRQIKTYNEQINLLLRVKEEYKNQGKAAQDYLKQHDTAILQNIELIKEQKKNEAEVFKAKIDGIAARSEDYKNSTMYVEDQIKYWKMLLPLEQKGSAAYEKISQTILTLLSKSAPKLKASIKDIKDILDPDTVKIEATTGAVVNMYQQIQRSIVDVNTQFGILIDTVGRFSESSLGLSSNWTQALGDIQIAIVSFMHNASMNGEATGEAWAQSVGLGLQAVGTILNSVSNDLDVNSKESFRHQQNLQAAASAINGAAGIVNAWVSAMSPVNANLTIPGQIAIGSIMSAAIASLTGVQIAQIYKQKYNGESASVSSSGINATIVPPTQYTQAVQNANIESQLRDTRVYVVESDIQQTVQRVSVQESENTY